MSGYTDSAYRQLVKSLAPRALVVSEFVSSDALHYGSQKTLRMLEYDPAEQPLIVQIFGKRPEHFAQAARLLESQGVAAVDINMGCPARKVVSSDHGSALLKNPQLAREIIESTVAAVQIPVSVKMRLGIENSDGLLDFARMVEDAGASLLTIHGRTARQQYTGTADYTDIYKVKEILKIPVVGNGDITSVADFDEQLKNLDGLMVGRATVGDPWLMAALAAHIAGESYTPPRTLAAKLPTILRHAQLLVATKGEAIGIREMRKYLASYVRGESGARALRQSLVRVETYTQAEQLLMTFVQQQTQ